MARSTWLLLHGTQLTPNVWDDITERLAATGPVVTPNLSHRPGTPCDQGWHARRVLADLPDGNLDVVGHSFGGHVALEVVLAARARVRSLTIVCSRDTPFPPFAAAAAEMRASGTVNAEGTLARWFAPDELAADGPLVRYARHCLTAADPVAWAHDLDAIGSYDRSEDVPALDISTTLIAAELDQVATVDAMTALAGRLPHARLHVVGGSHMSPFVHPDRLTELLKASPRR